MLRPVTIIDPYSGEKISVWAATEDFFKYFLLDEEDMSMEWIKGSKWSFVDAPKTHEGYRLLRRGPKWAEFFNVGVGMVLSDDEIFLEEIIVGLPIEMSIDVNQRSEFGTNEQDVLEVVIRPKRNL